VVGKAVVQAKSSGSQVRNRISMQQMRSCDMELKGPTSFYCA
jgi:hypothetical protein